MSRNNIEAIYPLSPLQQGILFHTLYAPTSGVYFNQLSCILRGDINIPAFKQAWQEIIDRHAILRTAFVWERRNEPLQVVRQRVNLPWEEYDWRGLPSEEQQVRLNTRLEEDRTRGFDLAKPPLMRLVLSRIAEDSYYLIWSSHHLLIDGWSKSLLFKEFFEFYQAFAHERPPRVERSRPYRDYIAWLQQQDRSQAETFWRKSLAGFTAPTPLGIGRTIDHSQHAAGQFGQQSIRLPAALTTELQEYARRHRLTLNTMAQGVWALLLSRYSGEEEVLFGTTTSGRPPQLAGSERMVGLFINTLPVRVRVQGETEVIEWLQGLQEEQAVARQYEYSPLVDVQGWSEVGRGLPLFDSIFVFENYPVDESLRGQDETLEMLDTRSFESTNYPLTVLAMPGTELSLRIVYDTNLFDADTIERMLGHYGVLLEAIVIGPERRLAELPLLTTAEQKQILQEWNETREDYPTEKCLHELFEEQVARTPEALALKYEAAELSYGELNERANQLARHLRRLGVRAESLVGIMMERSMEMVVALLGVLKAGGAYVPLDPEYPQERLTFMMEDAGIEVLLTQEELSGRVRVTSEVKRVNVDTEWEEISAESVANVETEVTAENLAYVIYTSGSTGKPKGVMVSHRTVANFFTAMDGCIGDDLPGGWLAVTSISFDISVLELFWTLARGFRVIVHPDQNKILHRARPTNDVEQRNIDFSLFYFAADEGQVAEDRYRLLIEGAKFADQHGFSAVWTPERHFHAFGGLYANPAITSAAIATITERIQIRAGSVVLPLHNPIRVAEEWAMVDNLSGGRIGVSFASGWHANDFALATENFADRKEIMFREIETVGKLWRGESVTFRGGAGNEVLIKIFPRPVQKELPVWITAAMNPETFRMAGETGANLLTHLLGQSLEELSDKIKIYRDALLRNGHADKRGHVTLMLHAFVGEDESEVRRKVYKPFCNYLRSHLDLLTNLAQSLGRNINLKDYPHDDMEALLGHAFDRYFETSALLGTPDSCLRLVRQLKSIGVDEVACLIDFGVDADSVISNLHYLDILRQRSNEKDDARSKNYSLPDLIKAQAIDHLQCTPSLARMLAEDNEALSSLKSLRRLLIGGEAFPISLAQQLRDCLPCEIYNLYGPTETTIWSTVYPVREIGNTVAIGRPVANTQVYILDRHFQPVPVGISGELYIGGEGVVRGYRARPDLTAEKFIPDPFGRKPGARLYRTGDVARYLPGGTIEFLGRVDDQIKIRGFRIEVGEIEATLAAQAGVQEAVVVARDSNADEKHLVAYVVINEDGDASDETAIQAQLQAEQVAQWETVFDQTYKLASAVQDPKFNIAGWKSSYTGAPISAAEMREWVDVTVDEILSLNPKRVLEIGCGSGLLLYGLAPRCEKYWGTDFSHTALDNLRQQFAQSGQEYEHVNLLSRNADDLSALEAENFDAVILNSVVQYFPSIDYLRRVLAAAVNAITEDGFIYVGDVRSLPLLQAFHTSVELAQAPPSLPVEELRRRVQKRIAEEEELVIDPRFFYALKKELPRISHVSVVPRRGRYHNELTRFRYQVILHVGSNKYPAQGVDWVEWQKDEMSFDALRRLLIEQEPETLAMAGWANARLSAEVKMLEMLSNSNGFHTAGELRDSVRDAVGGADPEDLWQLSATGLPYKAEISWGRHDREGRYDLVLRRSTKLLSESSNRTVLSFPSAEEGVSSWSDYANNPLRGRAHGRLVQELRRRLRESLPEYMVPSSFVLLDKLPLTPNGKVNRRALPAPESARPELKDAFLPPRTPTEQILVDIWCDVLRLDRVGVHDNFFDLGGHSLMATRCISQVRQTLQLEIPLRRLFEQPTVAGLARTIDAELSAGQSLTAPPIERLAARRDLPLSFAQQRLWFLDQLEPGNPAYNNPFALRVTGHLNQSALERTLNEIVRRHEALRTEFRLVEEGPIQVVAEAEPLHLTLTDLSDLPEAERELEVRRLTVAEARLSFDLSRGPMLRVKLLRLGPEEHIVLLTMHHIASDGWSIGVLVREVVALYEPYSKGKESPLPDLVIQYADFANWQRQWLRGEVLEEQLEYWKRQLSGALPELKLPADRPHPAVRSYRGERQSIALSVGITRSLKELSRKEGVTLFMTLLAAFQTLLHRYTGQEDIVVGTDIANRNRAETENLIGFFVNQLVLRTDLSGEPNFRQLLKRVREVALGAYAHQDVPFERLVDELHPQRDLSRSPLFQVKFVLQNASADRLEMLGLTLRNVPGYTQTAMFDLLLLVIETPDGLSLTLEYNTDIFEPSTAGRLLGHYRTLLEGIVADPEQGLSELPIFTDAERYRLLAAGNNLRNDFLESRCFHELFEEQVARTPEGVAAVFEERQLTYRELNSRANRVAHYLQSLGVTTETPVGICMDRSLEMIVGLLGILKAGGAYVPLDPAYPLERLNYMIEDAQLPVLLTQERLADALPARWAQLVCIDADQEVICSFSDENLHNSVAPDNPAYVIYTSGSTGKPKGVVVTHGGLSNLAEAQIQTFNTSSSARVLQFASLSFDASIFEIVMALRSGATLCLATQEELLPGEELMSLLRTWRISSVTLPPTALAALPAEELPELKTIIVAGEPCAADLVARWIDGRRFFNAYGPTEATVWTSVAECFNDSRQPPIGRPILNTEIYILDQRMQPVPVGVIGELYLGGVGLARGYLGRAELTAERFVPHPFSEEAGARLYRTGDLGRYGAEGEIEYAGRVDAQVKVRGHRIELGEIEARLGEHVGVSQCAVVAREEEDGQKRLVAYIVAEGGGGVSSSELRRHLKERLPEYMVPGLYVELATLPLTANGKVDRRALPGPEGQRPELEERYVEPRSTVEQKLAVVWREVLRVERVGVQDNFFELGGDSILAIQVVAKAAQAGVHFTARQLFAHQCIAELAAVTGEAGSAVEAPQGEVTGAVVLTPIQRWFFEGEAVEAVNHFNQAVLLEVRQRVEMDLLERAVAAVVAHHDGLRLRYQVDEAGNWQQECVGVAQGRAVVRLEDLSEMEREQQRAELERLADEMQGSLDIAAGPTVRVTLFELGASGGQRVQLIIHHLMVDGVSWRILLEDLEQVYGQLERGEEVRLRAKSSSFQQWAERLAERARSEALEQEAEYWLAERRSRVKGLRVKGAGVENLVGGAGRKVSALSAGETERLLREVSTAYRVRIDEVLLGALGETLRRWRGERQVLVEVEGHGREVEESEGSEAELEVTRTVGWFTTLYPVLLEARAGEWPVAGLKRVKEEVRGVPGRGIGYGLLRYVRRGEVGKRLSEMPQAEVSFNYLGQLDEVVSGERRWGAAREGSGRVRSERGRRRHLISVDSSISGGQLRVMWSYSGAAYEAEQIEELAQLYLRVLGEAIEQCQTGTEAGTLGYTPSDFPDAHLSQPELKRLLSRANLTNKRSAG